MLLPNLSDIAALTREYDPDSGFLDRGDVVERRLSDLRGCFADAAAFEAALASGDQVVYRVQSAEMGDGQGDLHYGLGTLMPGRIGEEYYLTKGHFHSWREAAEVYIGLRGHGGLLLEEEDGRSRLVELRAGTIVYVPGSTAHRTVNTGDVPLVYLGVYPARAGHDYTAIAEQNFRLVVVDGRNGTEARDREQYMRTLAAG